MQTATKYLLVWKLDIPTQVKTSQSYLQWLFISLYLHVTSTHLSLCPLAQGQRSSWAEAYSCWLPQSWVVQRAGWSGPPIRMTKGGQWTTDQGRAKNSWNRSFNKRYNNLIQYLFLYLKLWSLWVADMHSRYVFNILSQPHGYVIPGALEWWREETLNYDNLQPINYMSDALLVNTFSAAIINLPYTLKERQVCRNTALPFLKNCLPCKQSPSQSKSHSSVERCSMHLEIESIIITAMHQLINTIKNYTNGQRLILPCVLLPVPV